MRAFGDPSVKLANCWLLDPSAAINAHFDLLASFERRDQLHDVILLLEPELLLSVGRPLLGAPCTPNIVCVFLDTSHKSFGQVSRAIMACERCNLLDD